MMIKNTKKIAMKEINKAEKIAMKEINKAEKIAMKEVVKYEEIAPKISSIEHNTIVAKSIYDNKSAMHRMCVIRYRHKTNIAKGIMNIAIEGSKNAPTKSAARSAIKAAKDAFIIAYDKTIYPELVKADKELALSLKSYTDFEWKLSNIRSKYEKIKAKHDIVVKDAVSKRVYFEIGKRTNMDCASVVLSFLY